MTEPEITAWLLPLQGHALDLEDLRLHLAGASAAVVRCGEGHALRLSATLDGADDGHVQQLAQASLALINGGAGVLIPGFRPVHLAEGLPWHTEAALPRAAPVEQASMGALIREAGRNRTRAEVLSLMGEAEPAWSALQRVLLLVQADAGGRLRRERWISARQVMRFDRSARCHGGETLARPLVRLMPLASATALMRELVARWRQTWPV